MAKRTHEGFVLGGLKSPTPPHLSVPTQALSSSTSSLHTSFNPDSQRIFSPTSQKSINPIVYLQNPNTPLASFNTFEYEIKIEILTTILSFTSSHTFFESQFENVDNFTSFLLSYLFQEEDKQIRSIIVRILGKIAQTPNAPCLGILEVFVKLFSQTKSKKLLVQLMELLADMTQIKAMSTKNLDSFKGLIQRILTLSLSHLHNLDCRLRSSAIQLVSNVVEISEPSSTSQLLHQVQLTLSHFTRDPDPRVRTSAFQGILTLHQRGSPLSMKDSKNKHMEDDINDKRGTKDDEDHMSVYYAAVSALDDDYEEVRIAAAKTIWLYSTTFKNYAILCKDRASEYSSGSGEKLRLIDHGFAKICSAVMDGSIEVRTMACKLLGSFHHVSTEYLFQTLSKEVLTGDGHGKFKIDNTQSDEKTRESDENTVKPEHELNYNWNIFNAGAAGAFIHALEDEFFEVRMAAVDSLCMLATKTNDLNNIHPSSNDNHQSDSLSSSFSFHAINFLVDMFNDEIEAVRVNAIDSVRKIGVRMGIRYHERKDAFQTEDVEESPGSQAPLRENHLHIVLSVLEEGSVFVRNAVQKLLSSVRLSNITCLHATVQALLLNLSKYPTDQKSIFGALRGLGLSHSSFCEFLIHQLLHIDPRFVQVEPHTEDIFYVASMVVVLNAAVSNPTIFSLLPPYCMHHYRYLKDKFPDYFPVLDIETNASTSLVISNSKSDVEPFLQSSLAQLRDLRTLLERGFFSEADLLIQQCALSLKRICTLSQSNEESEHEANSLYSKARFYIQYLKCFRVLSFVTRNFIQTEGLEMEGLNALKRFSKPKNSRLDDKKNNELEVLAWTLLENLYPMQNLFLGVSFEIQLTLMVWRIFAHLLLIMNISSNNNSHGLSTPSLYKEKDVYNNNANNTNEDITIIQQVHELNSRIQTIQEFCLKHKVNIPSNLSSLLSTTKGIQSTLHTPSIFLSNLTSLTHQTLVYLASNILSFGLQQVGLCSSTIHTPIPNTMERPLEFRAAYPLEISITATLHNLEEPSLVIIAVEFVGNLQLYTISNEHFTLTKPHQYQLDTSIHVSINKAHWTANAKDTAPIYISLLKTFSADLPQDLDLNVTQNSILRVKQNGKMLGAIKISKQKTCFLLPTDWLR